MRQELLVLRHRGKPRQAPQRHVHVRRFSLFNQFCLNSKISQLRVGAPRHWLHAGHVRPSRPLAGDPGRRGAVLRLLLPTHGPNGLQLPQRRRHGHALRQHEVSRNNKIPFYLYNANFFLQVPDPNFGLGNVRADAPARRLHALLLLLPLVPAGLQARAFVRRRVRYVGDDLGVQARRLAAVRPLPGSGSGRNLQGHYPQQRDGFHRHN